MRTGPRRGSRARDDLANDEVTAHDAYDDQLADQLLIAHALEALSPPRPPRRRAGVLLGSDTDRDRRDDGTTARYGEE